jgi:8-oxo-dGTP diphosphatase
VSHDRIEAAGVVLVRKGEDGPEVALVHRPHRSDWSLPKGKLESGERHEAAAVREAFEETGVRCHLGPSLGSRTYPVDGVPKRVRYWRATAADAGATEPAREADEEIDEVRWLGGKKARALLTYDDDRLLVTAALALPDSVPTVVLRHAEAVKRVAWQGSGDPLSDLDAARPLDDHGMDQAVALAPVLAAYGLRFIASSDARRCRATIAPFADLADLAVDLEPSLSEEGCAENPDETVATVVRLLGRGGPAVWCTHRPVLPVITAALARTLGIDRHAEELDPRLKAGAAIVLHRRTDGAVAALNRLDP